MSLPRFAPLAARRREPSAGLAVALIAAALSTASSCGLGPDGAPLGIAMRVDRITLDRLDEQLHLRVFPRGAFTCNAETGRVQRDGVDATDLPGRTVRPDERCGPQWNSLRAMYGEARPVDTCFARDDARVEVSLEVGQYLVLVEGSGQAAAPGGGTRAITLGSGCAEVDATAGATLRATVRMIEQADSVGVCGDGMVNRNELCDPPGGDDCNARCRFPERTVSELPRGARHRPAVAWSAGHNLSIAWHSTGDGRDDVWAHFYDGAGRPITSPAALANDHGLDATAQNEQRNVRLAASGARLTAVWETAEFTFANYDLNATLVSDVANPLPIPRDLRVNPTSGAAMRTVRGANPAAALSATRALWLFEDGGGALSASGTGSPGGGPPSADARLSLAGAAGATPEGPALAALDDGSFVAAWSAGAAGSRDVFAVRLTAEGRVNGAPVALSAQTAGEQDQVSVGAAGGAVLFAWRDASRSDAADDQGTTVRVRAFNAALEPVGDERVAVTTPAGDQARPTVTVGGGAALVAWEQGDGTVRGRMFSPSGSPQLNRVTGDARDFEVNGASDEMAPGVGPRVLPQSAYGGMNRFVVVWEDQGTRNVHYRTLIQ